MAPGEHTITDTEAMGEKATMTHEEAEHLGELTPEEKEIEKKLRRRIDGLIMPLVILVYLMNYIDRWVNFEPIFPFLAGFLMNIYSNNYAAAKLQGLKQDLHLHGTEYETALSILFVGYILMQVPSNLMLNYIGRPSLYLGFFVCAWGLVSALTSQVTTFGGIVACRFILGLVGKLWFIVKNPSAQY